MLDLDVGLFERFVGLILENNLDFFYIVISDVVGCVLIYGRGDIVFELVVL